MSSVRHKYDPVDDVFSINPGPEEELQMIERMAAYVASRPKTKKRKAAATKDEDEEDVKTKRRSRASGSGDGTPSMNPAMGKRTQKVVARLADSQKNRVQDMSEAVKSIYQGKGDASKTNWISQGTFTRVSGFCYR